MQFYLAPMEGITGYLYRNAFCRTMGQFDRYFTPFLSPNQNMSFLTKEIQEITPENNLCEPLIPQVLTNQSRLFLWTARELETLGYTEVNLNLGCPSKTVVSKGRGSGFLAYPDRLESFLDEIFEDPLVSGGKMKISVKTRIGRDSAEEFPKLMRIYNQYPFTECIVHPRTQKDFYGNVPDWDAFRFACEECVCPLVYNGDIVDMASYSRFTDSFPNIDRIMIGRGILQNPALLSELRGETPPSLSQWREFHDLLYAAYQEKMSGERNVLYKMKELWNYWGSSFPDDEKTLKHIRKCSHLSEYNALVSSLL